MNLNRNLAIQTIKDDMNNPYKQIILGFILLEESYDKNKRGEKNNYLEMSKIYFKKAKDEGFKEAEFILKIINDQQSSSISINKSIYRFLKDYKLDEKKKEIKSVLENIDISIIINILENHNHPSYQYAVGGIYLGIIEYIDISEKVFNIFNINNLFQYQDYSKNKDIIEFFITELKKIKPDIKKGINYLNRASDNGSIESKFFLGMLHLTNGYKIKIDDINYIEFLTIILKINKSNIMKFIKIFNKCGDYIIYNKQIGIKYLNEASVHSDIIKYILGQIYYNGKFITKDIEKAMYYFELSAKHNVVLSQYMIGVLCYIEKNKPHNISKSIYYLKLAAEQDFPLAHYCLGVIYLDRAA